MLARAKLIIHSCRINHSYVGLHSDPNRLSHDSENKQSSSGIFSLDCRGSHNWTDPIQFDKTPRFSPYTQYFLLLYVAANNFGCR